MLESMLFKKKILNSASPEALWGASDMYPSNTSVAFPLSSLPSGGTAGGVNFVTNAPGPISNAAYFTSGSSNIQFANTLFQLNGYTDFCVEWWQIINGNSIIASLWHPNVASGCAWAASSSLGDLGFSGNAAGFGDYTETNLFPFGVWAHCAVSRQGSTARFFANGLLKMTITQSVNFVVGDLPFYLGYRGEASGLSGGGYLAGFRLTRGQARYTKAFTPSSIFS